jgi:hypothetical protein
MTAWCSGRPLNDCIYGMRCFEAEGDKLHVALTGTGGCIEIWDLGPSMGVLRQQQEYIRAANKK